MIARTSDLLDPIVFNSTVTPPSQVFDCLKPRQRPVRVEYPERRKYTDTEKWCAACEEWLPHEQFWKDRNSPSGRQAYCRSCQAKYLRAWHAARKAVAA